jgi:hypothetical protein
VFPASYPHFFYGFLVVTTAWQIAFLMIGSNPVRFRPLMIPSIVEKLGYVVAVAVLHGSGYISNAEAMSAAPDLLLGAVRSGVRQNAVRMTAADFRRIVLSFEGAERCAQPGSCAWKRIPPVARQPRKR